MKQARDSPYFFTASVCAGTITDERDLRTGQMAMSLRMYSFRKHRKSRPRRLDFVIFPEREAAFIARRVIEDDSTKARRGASLSLRQLKEAATNWMIYPHLLLTLAGLSPVVGLRTYAPILVASLGFERLRSNALVSIETWIQVVLMIIWGYAGLDADCSCIPQTAISDSQCLPSPSPFVPHIIPINGSWLAVNSRLAEERSITMAVFNMAASATGIVGSQIFRQKDRPLYVIGWTPLSPLRCFLHCTLPWILLIELPKNLRSYTKYISLKDKGYFRECLNGPISSLSSLMTSDFLTVELWERNQYPNLDHLARDGLRFTDFHTASASSPTRSMLLSGTDNHIAGVAAMIETLQEFQREKLSYKGYLSGRVAALPEILRSAGYYTVMSGKWHLGLTPDQYVSKRGFERSLRAQTDNKTEGAANQMGWEPQLQNSDELPSIFESTPVLYVEGEKEIDLSELDPNFYFTDAFADKFMRITHPYPAFKGREVVPVRENTVTGWELFGRQAVRKGQWKAVLIQKPYGKLDPRETGDLSRMRKMQESLHAWDEFVKEVGLSVPHRVWGFES
ncbi:arylsulfatase [Paracoccidioides lutzii Pb01]|uniref:Arylsulfatase n=1 Tax=Paracoccidioides lutzii (strain ATCC MYA-826 / Pb01) TaxID=502779 RepID=C1H7S1_PARBA|nr:arylsulfatase [Paracoccidioides lutzii Pb01]EEH36394.2 arylsulfatase [Paracoccidioides lutzii Pb01]